MDKMRYLGGTGHSPNASRLNVGDVYEVEMWFNPGATALNGLVRDKDGALYVAQTLNDPAEWESVAASPVASAAKSVAKPVAKAPVVQAPVAAADPVSAAHAATSGSDKA